ncbi:hypothetical protein MCAMS1_02874 [biofilm metagenome]
MNKYFTYFLALVSILLLIKAYVEEQEFDCLSAKAIISSGMKTDVSPSIQVPKALCVETDTFFEWAMSDTKNWIYEEIKDKNNILVALKIKPLTKNLKNSIILLSRDNKKYRLRIMS